MKKPIVWTIAGLDSSNGAGLSADLQVFTHLGAHGCALATAVTAQHAHAIEALYCLPSDLLAAQLRALRNTMPASAIKIGMVGSLANLQVLQEFLSSFRGYVVLDPVMISTSGHSLLIDDLAQYIRCLRDMLSNVTLLTPNKQEAELLLKKRIINNDDIEQAAQDLIKLGAHSVCIKGGHFTSNKMSHDFWTNGVASFWLSAPRLPEKNYRGTGCAFSAAAAASLTLNHRLQDALVLAKMYVTRGIRLAQPYRDNAAFFAS